MSVGSEVDRMRRVAGLSKQRLARKSGLTRQAIHLIIQDKRVPRPDTLEKLLKALHATPTSATNLRERVSVERAARGSIDQSTLVDRCWGIILQALERKEVQLSPSEQADLHGRVTEEISELLK